MSATETKKRLPDLRGFYGSEIRYRHPLTGKLYTEGLECIAKECGAYWLIDAIMFAQRTHRKKLMADPRLLDIQFWTLSVKDGKGALVCQADTGEKTAITIPVPSTDFPDTGDEGLMLYFENDTLCLPMER